MLRITNSGSAAGAKEYFDHSLRHADYYADGQEIAGRWHGLAAGRLELSGEVTRDAFRALIDNRHPVTGTQLTPRMKDDRRPGTDFTFNAPKSVSIIHALTRDERIVTALRESVEATMAEIERDAKTRVRQAGRNEDRTTGNLVWADFLHTTARPVDGFPDPHLHVHAYVPNLTWDDTERRWKALQIGDVKADAPYYEAVFLSRLALAMRSLGYGIERQGRFWDVAGVPRGLIEQFSRRTREIAQAADELGITNPETKATMGARTRDRKIESLSSSELRDVWISKIGPVDRRALDKVIAEAAAGGGGNTDSIDAAQSVEYALAHSFERSSVARERTVLTTAMHRSYGDASPEAVGQAAIGFPETIRRAIGGSIMVTTRQVLDEERAMLEFARNGRLRCRPLGEGQFKPATSTLTDDQCRAIAHVLTSRDRLMMIRGGAGTGKTTLMQEAVSGIRQGGHDVLAFAPTANGRDVLRKEGFAEAETLQRLLVDEELQQRIADKVLWIDEAGLVSAPDMAKLTRLADIRHCRIVLSGDTRQHGSVVRGDAMRLLETQAGIRPAEVREIMRQRDAYKEAVKAIAGGDVESGFHRLDAMGCIVENRDATRYAQLAANYASETAAGRSVLVVSPTHREKDIATREIRSALQRDKRLGAKAHTIVVLKDRRWTEAQKSDPANYHSGEVVKFTQNAPGVKRGARLVVDSAEAARSLPLDLPERFRVYDSQTLELRAGDLIRITDNGETLDGHRLNNGSIYRLRAIDRDGNLVLDENGWKVARDFGHLDYGYCSTSVASQGSTVDTVLLAMGSDSQAAMSREQFYVGVSRGRSAVRLYTDDKTMVLDAVSESRARGTATELIGDAVDRKGAPLSRKERLEEHGERVRSMLRHRAEEMFAERTADYMRQQNATARVSEPQHMGGLSRDASETRR